MPIPQLLESTNDSPLELTMGAGEWEILPGIRTPTTGFNGPYLGPTVRVRNGQDVSVVYRNTLMESVAVHGHGLHVPGELDGGPQREIEPDGSWSLELPIRQQACTSWYHPHTHGKTGSQTYQGLAGFIIIDDENSDSLPLPKTYGVDDLPVVVQDRTLDSRGRLVYSVDDIEDGFMAETITVNGITNPVRAVPAGPVRLRLLNGSNARYYRFRFSDDRMFYKIATDGGFLEEPVPIREVVMLPGERNEIVVDFSDGSPATLVSGLGPIGAVNTERRDRDDRERRDGDSRERRDGDNRRRRNNWEPGGLNDTFEILEFTVDPRLPAFRGPLPRRLNTISRPTVRNDWPVRRFELFMDGDRRRRSLFRQREDGKMSMGINGRPMDMRVINERVRRNQWERWVVRSYDGSHPFHVHGCSLLLLSQGGIPVSDENAGWKDTVRVDERAEFIVRFEHQATDEYPYMYHCHILEHEDRGMMGQFTVT
jgi:blue copper oxidase